MVFTFFSKAKAWFADIAAMATADDFKKSRLENDIISPYDFMVVKNRLYQKYSFYFQF